MNVPAPTRATSEGAGPSGHGDSSWAPVDAADPRIVAVLADLDAGERWLEAEQAARTAALEKKRAASRKRTALKQSKRAQAEHAQTERAQAERSVARELFPTAGAKDAMELRVEFVEWWSMGKREPVPEQTDAAADLPALALLPPVLERAPSAGTATSTEPDSNDAWSDHASSRDDISLLSTDDECPMHLIALQRAGAERERRMRRAPCNSRFLPIIFCIRAWCPYRPSMNYLILPWCRRDSQLRHTLRQGLRDAGSPVSLLATDIIELLIFASVGSDPRLMEIM